MNQSGNKFFDILIVGGGPAGLAAAVAAGQAFAEAATGDGRKNAGKSAGKSAGKPTVAILEKKEVPGKKLSATGNGRCNISNTACCDDEVNGFFDSIGLMRKADDAGRIYPYSEEAGQVTGLLVDSAVELNTKIFTNCQVSWVKRNENSGPAENGGFVVGAEFTETDKKNKKNQKNQPEQVVFSCKKLLIATGGKSYAVFGSTGDGFAWARSLGHNVTRLAPSLVPVQVEENPQFAMLSGLRAKGKVSLLHCGSKIYEEKGEIQFNRDSISGICIMNISKLLVLAEGKPFKEAFAEYHIEMDLVPDFTEDELTAFLRGNSCSLTTVVKKKMADYILSLAKKASPEEIAHLLKHLKFNVTGTKGWNEAQVTRGGVMMDEVDAQTMESKLVKGLYFAGEVMDFDGFCGGYNLNYAWLSGSRAGKDMANNV